MQIERLSRGKNQYNLKSYNKRTIIVKIQKELADLQRKYGLLTPNCTTSIHLLLFSLNLKKDDEVIAPECTWIASVSPVIQERAKLILCDVNKNNFCISIKSLKKYFKRTKVIISVNVYGNMADYDELQKICKKRKILLIEDAAESLGSYFNKKISGSFGDASVFSFHRTKTITTGEGGMLPLDNKKLYKNVKLLEIIETKKQRIYTINTLL